VHSERIYLAGRGAEAQLALETGLAHPEWFGGIVAISAKLSRGRRWLARYEALRGKRVFLGADGDDAEQLAQIADAQRLLWSAGMNVRAFSTPAAEQVADGLLREIDRWMIEAIEQPQPVA
jgi:predicted esterase